MNYYIADLHFRHKDILKFDGRPYSTIEEMEEDVISRWNARVGYGDTVYILGDFGFGSPSDWETILIRLKGNKVLMCGNHDAPKNVSAAFTKRLFREIHICCEKVDKGRHVIISHYPIMFYKHSYSPKFYMLCGHVHGTAENDCLEQWTRELRTAAKEGHNRYANLGQIYNVGCMMPWMDYTPRTLDEIVERHW